jgi:hypothetical protein
VTAWRETLREAQQAAYEAVQCIGFEGAFYRKDIGAKGLSAGARPDQPGGAILFDRQSCIPGQLETRAAPWDTDRNAQHTTKSMCTSNSGATLTAGLLTSSRHTCAVALTVVTQHRRSTNLRSSCIKAEPRR